MTIDGEIEAALFPASGFFVEVYGVGVLCEVFGFNLSRLLKYSLPGRKDSLRSIKHNIYNKMMPGGNARPCEGAAHVLVHDELGTVNLMSTPSMSRQDGC